MGLYTGCWLYMNINFTKCDLKIWHTGYMQSGGYVGEYRVYEIIKYLKKDRYYIRFQNINDNNFLVTLY